MWPMLIGAGLGVLKGVNDRQQAQKDARLQGELQRWSPWTGLKGDMSQVTRPNMMGSIMQGGLSGAAFGQQMGGLAKAFAGSAPTATTDVYEYDAPNANQYMQPGAHNASGYYVNKPAGPVVGESSWFGLRKQTLPAASMPTPYMNPGDQYDPGYYTGRF